MRKRLGCLEQTIAAAALHFLGDPEMQFHARPGQQTLIHCIAHERVFELIFACRGDRMRQIKLLHVRERRLDIAS